MVRGCMSRALIFACYVVMNQAFPLNVLASSYIRESKVFSGFPLYLRSNKSVRFFRGKITQEQKTFMTFIPAKLSATPELLLQSMHFTTPELLFQSIFMALTTVAIATKFLDRNSATSASHIPAGPKVRRLQIRFLMVFWLLRMADWLQGPYFYEVYASKVIHGSPVSLDLVSKLFLVGFGTTGLLGPLVGRLVDNYGRRAGTLAYALLYTIGALSVCSLSLPILFFGRFASGVGTSLLFCAPESWLVGEHHKAALDSKWLIQTFGWAYAGDSLVAISAGLLAGTTAALRGPTGPFEISVLFLAIGALLATVMWDENTAPIDRLDTQGPKIADAWNLILKDKRILITGTVQSLFEGAMYIFVLQWPPSLVAVVKAGPVPYGKVFSCFMASCLIGSNIFTALSRRGIQVEKTTAAMLVVAAGSMAIATAFQGTSLAAVFGAFLAFEVCVGMYFPSIGTLRSRYLPDSHRSVLVNIFGLPLNLIVVSVFLSIHRLGIAGALAAATAALALAAAAQLTLVLSTPPLLAAPDKSV